MAWETKPGTGSLFKNRERKTGRHPNLKGEAVVEINGESYTLDLAAWTKETRTGDKFLSLSVKLKSAQPSTQSNSGEDLDDAFGSQWDEES